MNTFDTESQRDGWFDRRRDGAAMFEPGDLTLPVISPSPPHQQESENIELKDSAPIPSQTHNSTVRIVVPVPAVLSKPLWSGSAQFGLPDGKVANEFSHLTYTAVTVDPQGFDDTRYCLRQNSYGQRRPRHTEMLVGITVYNEQKDLLRRTLQSLSSNINHLCGKKDSKVWGRHGWQKVVVCILVDGIDSVDAGVLDVLKTVGLYQDGLCRKKTPDGKTVTGHLFEYTSQFASGYLSDETDGSSGTYLCPVQLMLFIKASNHGKLNSYRWMYNAFAKRLDPNVVIHVDVGTKLKSEALYTMWKYFDIDPQIGVACGELACLINSPWDYLNPLVAAQNFEYKVGSQLDRAFESATGLLSLLPGAFSAYRYVGSAGAPLEDILMGDPTWAEAHSRHPGARSPLNLNRHLADDRAICFQIVTKKNTRWLLRYSPVQALTDIPTTTTDSINQRRRWLNGAFFSTIYFLKRIRSLGQSDHTLLRKIVFCIPLVHSVLALVLAWFSLAAFLLTTFTINSITGEPPDDAPIGGFPFGKATPIVNAVIQIVYIATILFQFILALGSRPRNHRISYIISFGIFGIVQVYLIMNIVYLIKRVVDYKADDTGASSYAYIGEFYADLGQVTVIVAAFSVFGVYIVTAFLSLDPWHLFTSFAQFLFISSSYVNILNIYAFSNTHDVTWGKESRHEELPIQRPDGPGPAMIERRFTFGDQDPAVRSAKTERDDSPEARDREFQAARDRVLASEEPRERDAQRPRVIATADALMEFRTIILAACSGGLVTPTGTRSGSFACGCGQTRSVF
ncbi:hypothetical protein FZEAL_1525 [Fusarium zealandicum]|uniref:Chitin synthase n=1 Tax=Fusarium zealandicum TaxID=1053134 RepID=A0A8H4USL7_9HYPO|nr:hypothetical protein FZEAL_1525 [Fusarium zealandicum]